jgi:hypothetical protein
MTHFKHINKNLHKTGTLIKQSEFHGLETDTYIEDNRENVSSVVTTDLIINRMAEPFISVREMSYFLLAVEQLHPNLTEEDWNDLIEFCNDNLEIEETN